MSPKNQTPEEWRGIDSKQKAVKEFIDDPSRENLHELLSELWVVQRGWNNIDHFLDEYFLADQTPDEIAETIDKARRTGDAALVEELDGFGWPVASETLSAIAPDEFALLNTRSVEGMEALGYDVPNPKSASPEQYRQFCDDIEDAVTRYPLKELAEEIEGSPSPSETPDYLIADLCFAFHYDDDSEIDLSELEEETLSDFLDPELAAEVANAVATSPRYRDTTDFLYAAIRNELDRI